jgi:hypothetical protein
LRPEGSSGGDDGGDAERRVRGVKRRDGKDGSVVDVRRKDELPK